MNKVDWIIVLLAIIALNTCSIDSNLERIADEVQHGR